MLGTGFSEHKPGPLKPCRKIKLEGKENLFLYICQVLRLSDLNVLELQCVMLTNHEQNIQSRFRLLKVWLCEKLESSNCRKLLFNFCKARSIETRADCFFCRFFNLAQAHITCRVLCFASSKKKKKSQPHFKGY